MSLLENIKKTLLDGSEKVVKIAEVITDKIKEVGEDGLELSKEVLAQISEKTSDITNIARYKLELNEMQKNIDSEMKNLGELVIAIYSSKRKEKIEGKIQTQINTIEDLKKDLLNKTTKYEDLRKIYSPNFAIQKLSDELAESDAVIDQVIVSGKSMAVNKTLKDLALPKEALISAIKRNDEIIIPDGNTKIVMDDLVTIIGKKNDVEKVKNKLSIK
jgi:K+/H+ antiporter YhaU regulatory subunit KhtT